MKFLILPLLLVLGTTASAAEKEYLDYNFDGVADYRIFRESNGKQHFYDIFLFNPKTKKYLKSVELSRLYNPSPDPETKEIHCRWPGGHSGAIFSDEVYQWKGNNLVYLRSVGQSNYTVDGKMVYIRVTYSLEDGKPKLEKLEIFKPEELIK